jgi:hypothetical protein
VCVCVCVCVWSWLGLLEDTGMVQVGGITKEKGHQNKGQ